MIFDDTLKNLIKEAFKEENDIFLRLRNVKAEDLDFDDVFSVIFLPSAFYGADDCRFSDYTERLSLSEFNKNQKSIFADIRFIGDSEFREYLKGSHCRRIILPFAECSQKGEYLFRNVFSWIGEFRAECPYYIQVLALFPEINFCYDSFISIFSAKDVLCIGQTKEPDIKVYETPSSEAKFYYTAAEAEKYAYRKTAVYFNSRNEAEAFCRFLSKRKTAFVYYNGSLTPDEKRQVLRSFDTGKIPLIIATRSFIFEAVFINIEKSIFCGVPFSVAHLFRCCASTLNITVICCPSDCSRNDRISLSLSEKTEDSEIYTERVKKLSEALNFIYKE